MRFFEFLSKISLLLLLLALQACSFTTGAHKANAEGFSGIIHLEGSRPRCRFASLQGREQCYKVDCQAVVIGTDGSEVQATGIREGISVDWSTPFATGGGEVSVERSDVSSDHLSQESTICLNNNDGSKVQFELTIREISTQHKNTEFDIVFLPFSAKSYGQVAAMLSYEAQTSQEKLGLQVDKLDPKSTVLGRPTSVCRIGEKTFIAAGGSVFVQEKDALRLFAGSQNPANANEFSHRLRTSLVKDFFGTTSAIVVACGKKDIYVLDQSGNRVLKIPETGRVELIAHSLDFPSSLTVEEDGSVLVVENNQISRIGADLKRSVVIGSQVSSGAGLLQLNSAVARDKEGAIFFAAGNKLYRVNKDGSRVVIAGTGGVGRSGDGGLAQNAEMGRLGGLVRTDEGEIYFSDFDHDIIRAIDARGIIRTVAGSGNKGFEGEHIPAREATLHRPAGVFYDNVVGLLFADLENQRVRRIDSLGNISTFAGTPQAEVKNEGAQFGTIEGIAIGPDESIYVADSSLHRVARIDPSGKVSVVAGTGVAGYAGDSGKASLAKLNSPRDILVGSDNTIYIADTFNQRIRVVHPNGTIFTKALLTYSAPYRLAWGPQGEIYFATLPSMAEGFGTVMPTGAVVKYPNSQNFATGLVPLGNQNILYTSARDNVVKIWNPTVAQQTTVVGGGKGFSGDGELSIGAKLNHPSYLTRDEQGRIYIADTNNGRVRMLVPRSGGEYDTATLMGGPSGKDCAGAIRKNIQADSVEKEVEVSLASLCYAQPRAFAIRYMCSANSPDPHITMALAQSFGEVSNVIRIRRPCP